MGSIKWDQSTSKVMNYLSQEKNILSDFRNLLQSRNYYEARLLLVCKQEAFQSLSKTFVQSMNLMQQLPQDVLNMFSSTSWTTISIKWGSNLSFCSCTIWWLHFAFGNHFSFNSHQKVTWNFFKNFKPWCRHNKIIWLINWVTNYKYKPVLREKCCHLTTFSSKGKDFNYSQQMTFQ